MEGGGKNTRRRSSQHLVPPGPGHAFKVSKSWGWENWQRIKRRGERGIKRWRNECPGLKLALEGVPLVGQCLELPLGGGWERSLPNWVTRNNSYNSIPLPPNLQITGPPPRGPKKDIPPSKYSDLIFQTFPSELSLSLCVHIKYKPRFLGAQSQMQPDLGRRLGNSQTK